MNEPRGVSRREWLKLAVITTGGTSAVGRPAAHASAPAEPELASSAGATAFERVTLEMSLKPFRAMDEAAINAVCETAFTQWLPIIRHARSSAVLLWSADGSEILDYRGQLDDEIEWARYIGIGSPPKEASRADPERRSLHSTPHLYIANPPRITYRWL